MPKGHVEVVSQKAWQDKVLWSLKLVNDPTWYGNGTTPIGCKKGDIVEFAAAQTNSGRWNITNEGINVVTSGSVQAPTPQAAPAVRTWAKKTWPPKDAAKDDYWKQREERDVETQKRIQLQASRNSAIETAKLLVESGAVKIPAKGDGMAVVLGLISDLTEKYNNETSGRGTVADGSEKANEGAGNAGSDDGDAGDEWGD